MFGTYIVNSGISHKKRHLIKQEECSWGFGCADYEFQGCGIQKFPDFVNSNLLNSSISHMSKIYISGSS